MPVTESVHVDYLFQRLFSLVQMLLKASGRGGWRGCWFELSPGAPSRRIPLYLFLPGTHISSVLGGLSVSKAA